MHAHCGSSLSLHSSHGHLHVSCALWVLLLISFLIISLINLLFLVPDIFNFLDVVDKYPAYFRWGPWHPGRERFFYNKCINDLQKRTEAQIQAHSLLDREMAEMSHVEKMSYLQSQMHFDESMESIADSDLEDGEIKKLLTSSLYAQRASGKPDAMVVQERGKCTSVSLFIRRS